MRTLVIVLWLSMYALVGAVAAAPAGEEGAIATAVREKNGNEAASIRVAGEWAVADEIFVGDGIRKRVAQALLRKINDAWQVTAELAGAGHVTPEALLYHEVPDNVVRKLVDPKAADDLKSVMKLLKPMLAGQYPEGYLFETVAFADNWAICSYRYRPSIKKSDVIGQILLRKTAGKWHLVEKAEGNVNLDPYGVPRRLQQVLSGAL